jgi:ATP-dependent DNA ligase
VAGPPRAFQSRPSLPIYAHVMLARPRTLPTGFIAPCLPTKVHTLPSGGLWLHEIKHDGFRIIARKDGERVRLYSRPGNDLTLGIGSVRRCCSGHRQPCHATVQ